MKKVISFLLIATLLLGTFIVPSSATIDGEYFVVIGSNVNLRSGPGTQYSSVGTVSYGYEFKTYTFSGNWAQVSSGKWINGNYIVAYDANISNPARKVQLSNATGTLNVRKAPTTAAPSIGSLSNNAYVTAMAETMTTVNGYTWVMISYGSNTVGWVASNYLVNR